MSAHHPPEDNGHEEGRRRSEAERIASAGIRNSRQLANFSLALGVGVLRGDVGCREANVVLGSVRETRRTVEMGQKIGDRKDVLDGPGAETPQAQQAAPCNGQPSVCDPEELALLDRLAEIRERRCNGQPR